VGLGPRLADSLTKAGPVFAVAAPIWIVTTFDLGSRGVALVGTIPSGLPPIGLPSIDLEVVRVLIVPAFLISLVGFVESVSVAQTLASKRRQRIAPDQELIGLGAANIASGISAGYPVTGGFARSVVNFDAGAQTPAAGIFTAIGIALATLFLTPWLANLPQATLAATIIVAVLSLVDLKAIGRVWRYSKVDFSAMAATIAGTLFLGVEAGIVMGVVLSLLAASLPHQPAACGGRGAGAGHRAFPQHRAPQGRNPPTSSPSAWTKASISPIRAFWRTRSPRSWPSGPRSGTSC
jgi:sulfate permease, SulP family